MLCGLCRALPSARISTLPPLSVWFLPAQPQAESCLPFSGKPFLTPLHPPERVETLSGCLKHSVCWQGPVLVPLRPQRCPLHAAGPLRTSGMATWPCSAWNVLLPLPLSQYLLLILSGLAKCPLLQEPFGNSDPHFILAGNISLSLPGVNSLNRHELSTWNSAAVPPGPRTEPKQTLRAPEACVE